MNKLCLPFITKGYNTLEIMLIEILQAEFYHKEFDRIYMDMTFNGCLFEKLNYLLDRIKQLFVLRDLALEFLVKINQREVTQSFLTMLSSRWKK